MLFTLTKHYAYWQRPEPCLTVEKCSELNINEVAE